MFFFVKLKKIDPTHSLKKTKHTSTTTQERMKYERIFLKQALLI